LFWELPMFYWVYLLSCSRLSCLYILGLNPPYSLLKLKQEEIENLNRQVKWFQETE
jgi:hypothetical protein